MSSPKRWTEGSRTRDVELARLLGSPSAAAFTFPDSREVLGAAAQAGGAVGGCDPQPAWGRSGGISFSERGFRRCPQGTRYVCVSRRAFETEIWLPGCPFWPSVLPFACLMPNFPSRGKDWKGVEVGGLGTECGRAALVSKFGGGRWDSFPFSLIYQGKTRRATWGAFAPHPP